MKHIQDHKEIVSDNTEVLYGRTGDVLDNTKEKNYAKTTVGVDGNTLYFLRTYNSVLYDPLVTTGRREEYEETQVKLVSKETFDFYMMYLKTNNSLYFTRAQRGFINND